MNTVGPMKHLSTSLGGFYGAFRATELYISHATKLGRHNKGAIRFPTNFRGLFRSLLKISAQPKRVEGASGSSKLNIFGKFDTLISL